MTTNTTYIYGLFCPASEQIRYVGVSKSPVERFRQHISLSDINPASSKGLSKKQEWIWGLLKSELEPELVILQEVPVLSERQGQVHPRAKATENEWIVRLLKAGHKLTNSSLPIQQIKNDEQIMREAMERGRRMFGTVALTDTMSVDLVVPRGIK